MSDVIKPTADELRIIRAYAEKTARLTRVKLEPGIRININNSDIERSINILLVTEDDPTNWSDTDLWSTANWNDFKKGFPSKNGAAIVDFYVYSLGYSGQLECNVQAHFENGRLVHMDDDTGRNVNGKPA